MDEHVMQEVPAPLRIIPDDQRAEASPYLHVAPEDVDHYRECVVHYFDNQMGRDILMMQGEDKNRMYQMLHDYADILEKILHNGIPILEHIQDKRWSAANANPHTGINWDHDCPIIREYEVWKAENVQNTQEPVQES
jgi:hypothetical protein